jgi:hypothetical protein
MVQAGDGLHRLDGIHRMQAGRVKPDNHISCTITMRNGAALSLQRFAMARRLASLQICGCYSGRDRRSR